MFIKITYLLFLISTYPNIWKLLKWMRPWQLPLKEYFALAIFPTNGFKFYNIMKIYVLILDNKKMYTFGW